MLDYKKMPLKTIGGQRDILTPLGAIPNNTLNCFASFVGTRMHSRIAFLAATCFVLSQSVAMASVPDRVPPANAEDAYRKADVVFLGRVDGVTKDQYGYQSLAEVRILKIWKGRNHLPPKVQIDGRGGPTYPARIFNNGAVYLFYLPVLKNGASLRADSFIHRVLPESEAQSDLVILERLKSEQTK
jgi:hypothetical protein